MKITLNYRKYHFESQVNHQFILLIVNLYDNPVVHYSDVDFV